MLRDYSLLDKMLIQIDNGLRVLFSPAAAERPRPVAETQTISESSRQLSGKLMRVNHTGEICAQALYQGQAFTARDKKIATTMAHAAKEEIDHLAWCASRITELETHTSYLNPLWYMGSLGLGIVAGLAGDRWSLGFLFETEKQVEKHLESHLSRLPKEDVSSRVVLEAMKEDEAKHASTALTSGAAPLPLPIKLAMQGCSKVMTSLSYWI